MFLGSPQYLTLTQQTGVNAPKVGVILELGLAAGHVDCFASLAKATKVTMTNYDYAHATAIPCHDRQAR